MSIPASELQGTITKKTNTTFGKTAKIGANQVYNLDDFEKQKKDEIKEVFDLFDTEQKGHIQGINMKICLKTLGIHIKKKELESILKEMFDKGLEDNYKFEQFYQVTKKKIDEQDPDVEMAKEFYLLCDCKDDVSKQKEDLTLTVDSIKQLAEHVGEILSKEEIEEMVSIVGGSKGSITKDEFVAFMRNPLSYTTPSEPASKDKNNIKQQQ